MKEPKANTQQEKTEIEQLSQAELVELVLGLQKIIQELQEKLAIATSKNRTNSKTSSQPPSLDLIQKSEKAKEQTIDNNRISPLIRYSRCKNILKSGMLPTIANGLATRHFNIGRMLLTRSIAKK